MTTMTPYEYAVEIQKKSGDEAPVTWLTVGELIALLRPQEDFLNAVEFALTDPAHDHFADEPPAPEDERQAAEVARDNETFPAEPSPTKDDEIADYIMSLTPDQQEFAAQIIDGVSSQAWWEAQKPIEF